MGQRLDLSINYEGVVLANAYYHWSAYSDCAARITIRAIDKLNEMMSGEYDKNMQWSDADKLRIAVEMLTYTGAGFNDEERDRIENSNNPLFENIRISPAIDRNKGLISVTRDGIDETEKWEEGRVDIDLATMKIDFMVFISYDSIEEYIKYNFDEEEQENCNAEDIYNNIYNLTEDESDAFLNTTIDNFNKILDVINCHDIFIITDTNGDTSICTTIV